MKLHESLTIDRIVEAVEECHRNLANIGLCANCGAEHDGCEPDARGYHCEECELDMVYGAEELLLHVA